MTLGGIFEAIGRRLFPSLAFDHPDHDPESERQAREAIRRAHQTVDRWNERTRESWRTDGQHA